MSFRPLRVASLMLVAALAFSMPPAPAQSTSNGADQGPAAGSQFYEIRTYDLGPKGDAAEVDQYLKQALVPALNRHGIDAVGVFAPNESDDTGADVIVVVIPYESLDQIASIRDALSADAQYTAAAKDYLDRTPKNAPYRRIRSEVLSSMACWPRWKVDAETLQNDDRVYELRLYESANERLGDLKVEMFNNGEVPIFLDSGVIPVFIGQCVVGPQMPNLTYLTVYPNEQARQAAWKAFRVHPDWKVLSKNPRSAGTVSHIDKFVLSPKPYSQM
ncbi:MAG: NIPSNAP family protein [Rhodopirellula sp. JB044]|uniref:NIPSNAP family protein n=1 Tax=Rhodopirellula sp. JB044 TaxID=3342844 RepID=UPI00370B37A8